MARSSAELLEKLSRQPTRNKVLILVGALGFFGLVYWYFFYSEMQNENRVLAGAIVKDKKKADDLREKRRKLDELIKKKKEIEEELARNAVRLPSSAELPAFFVHLQTQATAANVRLVKWTRESEVLVETYVKVPVYMEVRGTFYQILEYFKLLYETPRIITVEDLVIGDGKGENDKLVLTAKFRASTFREADRPPEEKPAQPAQPTQPAAGGAPAPGGETAPGGAQGKPDATKATTTGGGQAGGQAGGQKKGK